MDAYAEALARLRSCFAVVEASLLEFENSSGSPVEMPFLPRTPALEHDLQALNAGLDPITAEPKPIASKACYLGMRYVLEGSARGGVHIAKSLARRFPEIDERAFTFWKLQIRQAGHWTAFLAQLAPLDNCKTHQDNAVSGAIKGFDTFLDIMNKEP